MTADCGENLLNRHRADYGLFLEVHDHYSSRELVRARVVGMLLLFPYAPFMLPAMVIRDEGAPPPACLSLIDTRSGEVAWRRCLNGRTNFSPNWLEDDSVKGAVQQLLRGFPAA